MAKFKEHLPEKIVDCLEKRPMTRGQLKKKLGVPRSTLYDHLVKLMIQKKVIRGKKSNKNKMGRPKVWFKLV